MNRRFGRGPGEESVSESGIEVAPAGRHLVRCHFFALDGSMLEAYAKNVAAEGGRAAVVPPRRSTTRRASTRSASRTL
ncbi:MAG: hypothetical protein ACJ754_15405 [Pyrinomonadaceae bacterium]